MDTSCTDQESSTTELSISISISPNIIPTTPRPPFLSFPTPHDQSLRRVGSGTISVILDSAETSTEADSRKLPSSKLKGVVPQPNGRWGAQIYEKHQRVWLGTFNQQHLAAKAYDVAAQRFRGRYAVTNFKLMYETNEDVIETAFINSHSKSEIVDMLRKHTYNDELQQSKRKFGYGQLVRSEENGLSSFLSNRDLKAREQLFEKAVTPSDVGKLNRLVIPKQHAEKHFPLQNGSTSKATLLNFEDHIGGKVWRFRYSYWNSSQSYVLTKGWSRFVKEKNLKAGDIVSFQRSTGPDKQLLYIDWETRKNSNGLNPVGPEPVKDSVQIVRLFGVNIFKVGGSNGGVVDSICGGCNNKRKKEMELLLELDCSKKPRIIGAL